MFLCKDTGLFGEILVSQSPQIKSSGRFFFIKSARSVNTKCDNFITKYDDYYKVRQNIALRSLKWRVTCQIGVHKLYAG